MESNRCANTNDHNEYHTVPIRSDLPIISKSYQEESLQYSSPNDFWMKKIDPFYISQQSSSVDSTQRYEVQYSTMNGPYTSICNNHPILTAFLRAYNSHEDIILSPDDLWLMICIYFANYVNHNAAKLSHLYKTDSNNKLLTIENDQTNEADWETFLKQTHLQMMNYIRNDICNLLPNNFSTTTKVESLLSSLTIMSTFKKCLDCTYSINSCGIRNVHFMGTLNDWILLHEKTQQLQSFSLDNDEFFLYINGILPILEQFIQTYQGNVDNHFWDTIFDLTHTKEESNKSNDMYMNGWFLQLCYGYHMNKTCCMMYIELNTLIVPVHMENEYTDTSKTSYIVGGFHGVRSQNGTHKPAMSLVIMDDLTNVMKMSK